MSAIAEQVRQQRITGSIADERRHECRQELADAEREMGAFVRVFQELFGAGIATHAPSIGFNWRKAAALHL